MNNQLHKNISEIWNDDYIVPLYQRNFAWMEEQIKQLLQDIYDHHKKDVGNKDAGNKDVGNYYLGSLVVLQRNDGKFEVIDGQQRLTALQIICKDLNITTRPCLHYDSRPEVEDFFKELYKSDSCKECLKLYKSKPDPKIKRLVDALSIVSETKIRTFEGKEVSFGELPTEVRKGISDYLKKQVILIRVPLPPDTDVAAYFEIMNNRGRQLQPHEVIKALIMRDKLFANQRSVFATIWDACSQMNIPIQRSLTKFRKDNSLGDIFGANYDGLKTHLLFGQLDDVEEEPEKTIEEIISNNTIGVSSSESEPEESNYSSIIDFPNFLTHVLKLYDDNVELNGDKLNSAYEKVKSKIYPMEFIAQLLTLRVLFDRYVVKVRAENEEDENLQWVMHRPYMYRPDPTRDGWLNFKNTFSDSTDADDNESEGDAQKRIVKQLSMLQVSFRNRKYKNWLFDYLKWLNSDYRENIQSVKAENIITFLDDWIEEYFITNIENSYIDKKSGENILYKKGTKTPHFLFNFIDYLYWLEKTKGNSSIRFIEEVKDFRFKYYNSVEHHLPQSYEFNSNEGIDVDMIGNLCLISRSNNSSLNDKDTRQKIRGDGDKLQPKRRIMYHITRVENDWNKIQIIEHQKDIEQLIDGRKRVLRLSKKQS